MSVISDALVPSFSGRIPRRTYWLAVFVYFFFSSVLPMSFYTAMGDRMYALGSSDAFLFCAALYLIACYLLYFSAVVRRLHDIGRTGAWALLIFIPLVGQITGLVLGCLSSAEGANRYGPNPNVPEGEAGGGPMDTVKALSELERLLEKGLISREEFEREKARVLSPGNQSLTTT